MKRGNNRIGQAAAGQRQAIAKAARSHMSAASGISINKPAMGLEG